MGLEFELKYAATPAVLQSIQQDFGSFSPISMETTYFDTFDGALSAQKMTLRQRLENGISVCTLKTPGANGARVEWEVKDDWSEAAVRTLFSAAALPAHDFSSLKPLCSAHFCRLCRQIALPDCTVELALDEGYLAGSGKQVAFCEVEVELKAGSREAAVGWAESFARTYALTAEHRSKFQRALALTKGE